MSILQKLLEKNKKFININYNNLYNKSYPIMRQLTINFPLDMHLHLRDNEMLQVVAPLSAWSFAGALVMPNLVPAIITKQDVIDYKSRIKQAIWDEKFIAYMTLFFHDGLNREILEDIKDEILAIKLYPAGITTNSEWGVETIDIDKLGHIFQAMSDLDIPLCVHGETNGFVMDREKEFCSVYESLAIAFPNLKIIMEHITTADSVALLDKYPNLYATITLHHLYITLDDVAGGMLQPHLFCKPIAKTYKDRDSLLQVALNAHPKIMFGSDSAPHPQHTKECSGCAAGVFTAPIALQMLAQLFDKHNKLENLQKFVSDNAREIYNIKPSEKNIILLKEEIQVPEKYGTVISFNAGKMIGWKIV